MRSRHHRLGSRALTTLTTLTCALLVAAVCTSPTPIALAAEGWHPAAPGPAPVSNPLKGLMPFAPEDVTAAPAPSTPGQVPDLAPGAPPYSMEWVSFPLDRIVVGQGQYDWNPLEAALDAVAARGHQVVLRFYVDFPGRPPATPRYLVDGGLVAMRSYSVHDNHGASLSPDYDDPDMMSMLTAFIAALGTRYDADPRIGFITQGLVGFWGESHTWPFDGQVNDGANPGRQDWMPTRTNQDALIAAWDEAFGTTPTQVRYPSPASVVHAVGYHDDSFGYATLPGQDWHFWSLMTAQGATSAWMSQPMGGEIYPPIQGCVFSGPQACRGNGTPAQDIDEAVALTHVTWLIDDAAFTQGLTGAARDRALEVSARMGYVLTVDRWRIQGSTMTIQVANQGVAPFSYDWRAEVVALDAAGHELGTAELSGDLRRALPGGSTTLTGNVPVGRGATTYLLRVVNPLDGGIPLRFANAGQDTARDGYLTLGRA